MLKAIGCCLVFYAGCLAALGEAGKNAVAPALFSIRQAGKFGYIDETGRTVISPRFLSEGFEAARHFAGGLEPVCIRDRFGYIDPTGKVIIEPQFGLAQPFSEGLAAVRVDGGQWGYIDSAGRWVIPAHFESAGVFSEGRAQVVVDGKMGYIDQAGAFIVAPQYRSYSPLDSTFSEGLACVEVDGKWGFINREGGQFLLETYDLYLESFRKQTSEHSESRGELEFLGDAQLISQLKAKAAAEPPGTRKNNINTLLDLMAVSAMNTEGLKRTALLQGEENINPRLHAIAVLGRQGGSELLPFLRSLQERSDEFPRREFNSFDDLLRDAAKRATRLIGMRHERK